MNGKATCTEVMSVDEYLFEFDGYRKNEGILKSAGSKGGPLNETKRLRPKENDIPRTRVK
jgi:hypothetical protein